MKGCGVGEGRFQEIEEIEREVNDSFVGLRICAPLHVAALVGALLQSSFVAFV